MALRVVEPVNLTGVATVVVPQGPMHLPDAPPGWDEIEAGRRRGRRRLLEDGSSPPEPQHCSLERQSCGGIGAVTTKQRRKMEEIAALTMHPLPDVESMDFHSADAFLASTFAHWMANDYPRY